MEDFVDHLLDSGAWKHASTAELSEIMQDGMHGDECEVVDSEDVIRSENAMRAARSGFLGIAMQFSSPVRKYTTEGSYYSGWGYTRSTWIYADTFDEAWDMGVLWALERDVADKAKLKESA